MENIRQYDPSTELDIATLDDMAGVLVNREAVRPGALIWLDEQPRSPVLAIFGAIEPCQLRYLAAVLIAQAKRIAPDCNDSSDRPIPE